MDLVSPFSLYTTSHTTKTDSGSSLVQCDGMNNNSIRTRHGVASLRLSDFQFRSTQIDFERRREILKILSTDRQMG